MVRAGQAKRFPDVQRGAVRVKGGNFNEPRLENHIEDLLYDQETASHAWAKKQLANYLRKDIGSPTDPLLQVEKEYPNLHLPANHLLVPGEDFDLRPGIEYMNEHNKLTGSAPLTPWGWHADRQLHSMAPFEYANELAGPSEAPEWLSKLSKGSKIWSLADDSDELGFGHVLDYLNAAKHSHDQIQAFGQNALNDRGGLGPEALRHLNMHDAGLTLSLEQINRTSVADAVRKTAKWNELMAKNAEASPDLARGIKSVHKEYPEEGMKWVELGKPGSQNSGFSGFSVVKDGNGFRVQNPNNTVSTEFFSSAEQAQKAIPEVWGKHELSAGLNAEGKAMGHCVGGYCDEVAQRGTKIYSLRDAKGAPHVTVEVRGSEPWYFDPSKTNFTSDPELRSALLEYKTQLDSGRTAVQQRKYQEGWEQAARGRWVDNTYVPVPNNAHARAGYEAFNADKLGTTRVANLRTPEENRKFERWLEIEKPDLYEANAERFSRAPESVAQIKGKQNAAPVEKYLPFVQDFVKSGQWGHVGDLRNAGLIEHSGRYWTKPELEEAALKYGKVGKLSWPQSRDLLAHNGIDESRARAEFLGNFSQDQRGNFGPKATLNLPENYASGGAVRQPLKLADDVHTLDPIERMHHICDVAMTE
jgi:hypothetical protein